MATKKVALTYYFSLGGTDFSSEINSMDLPINLDTPEVTTSGDAGVRNYEAGLQDWTITVGVVFNDDSSTGLHTYLRSNVGTKVAALASVGGTSTATTSKPHLSGTVIVTPVPGGAAVGGADTHTLTFRGCGAYTWVTS